MVVGDVIRLDLGEILRQVAVVLDGFVRPRKLGAAGDHREKVDVKHQIGSRLLEDLFAERDRVEFRSVRFVLNHEAVERVRIFAGRVRLDDVLHALNELFLRFGARIVQRLRLHHVRAQRAVSQNVPDADFVRGSERLHVIAGGAVVHDVVSGKRDGKARVRDFLIFFQKFVVRKRAGRDLLPVLVVNDEVIRNAHPHADFELFVRSVRGGRYRFVTADHAECQYHCHTHSEKTFHFLLFYFKFIFSFARNRAKEHICSCSRFTRLSILTKVEINPLFTLFFSIISHNYAPVNTKIKKSLINFKNFFTFLENQNLFPPFICNIVLYTA